MWNGCKVREIVGEESKVDWTGSLLCLMVGFDIRQIYPHGFTFWTF